MSKIMDSVKDLSTQIAKVRAEYDQILAGIEEAKKIKESTRVKYNQCLDRGDEAGMSQCLRVIRTASNKINELKTELNRFPSLVENLYERQHEIVTEARAKRPEAEKAIQVAQENLRIINKEINHASHLLLSQINELNNALSKDKSNVSVSRASGIEVM